MGMEVRATFGQAVGERIGVFTKKEIGSVLTETKTGRVQRVTADHAS